MASLWFEKYRQNIDSFRGFIEKFKLSNRSEALIIIIIPGGAGISSEGCLFSLEMGCFLKRHLHRKTVPIKKAITTRCQGDNDGQSYRPIGGNPSGKKTKPYKVMELTKKNNNLGDRTDLPRAKTGEKNIVIHRTRGIGGELFCLVALRYPLQCRWHHWPVRAGWRYGKDY